MLSVFNWALMNMSFSPFFHRSLDIDFDSMTLRGPFANLAVRRLSNLSHNQREVMGWYYRDNSYWCEYGVQVRDLFMQRDAHLLQRTQLMVKFEHRTLVIPHRDRVTGHHQ